MKPMQKSAERRAIFFMLLCTAVYFTSYLTRKNYDVVLIDVVDSLGITKDQAGLVSTIAFVTYGIGQLISGFIGDHIKPRSLIIIGMSATAVCNILMPFMTSITPMLVLWGLNGFCQALFWPPLVRMMAVNLDSEHYDKACIWVSCGSSVATIAVYLIASLSAAMASWKVVFFVGAAAAVLMVVIWQLFAPKNDFNAPTKPKEDVQAPAPSMLRDKAVVILIALIGLAIVLQGILRDGVATWMPTLISDTFHLPSSVSILSAVLLPIFAMFSYKVADWLEARVRNELVSSSILFGISTAAAALLVPLIGRNAVGSVLLTALLTGCMHGINLMLIGRVPRYFNKYNKISTVAGMLNAFTYVGSGLATYFFAVLESHFGWNATIVSWVIVAGAGTLVCILTIGVWKKFRAAK